MSLACADRVEPIYSFCYSSLTHVAFSFNTPYARNIVARMRDVRTYLNAAFYPDSWSKSELFGKFCLACCYGCVHQTKLKASSSKHSKALGCWWETNPQNAIGSRYSTDPSTQHACKQAGPRYWPLQRVACVQLDRSARAFTPSVPPIRDVKRCAVSNTDRCDLTGPHAT
jgi:hypothetical protein